MNILQLICCEVKTNESWYIELLVVSGFIKELFSIDYINIYLFSIFFFDRFCSVEKYGVPHNAYIVIYYLFDITVLKVVLLIL